MILYPWWTMIKTELTSAIESGEQGKASQQFYHTYYTDILQHMFSVVKDTSHTAGFTMQANILAYMFTLVENNKAVLLNASSQTVPTGSRHPL